MSCCSSGRYELAESTLRQNLDLLDSSQAGEPVSQVSISYVASCGWLAFSLAERGEFNLAQGYVDRAQKAAQATRNAYGLAIAWALAGLVAMRRGHLREALPSLERSLEACREKHLAVWQPIPSSILGLTQMFAGDQEVTLILDRRRGERRQLVQPHEPERRVAARRRTPGVDDELASRGFVIVLDAASPPPTG